jgi:hypothetical protein
VGRGPAGATADREKDGKVFLSADGAKLAREVRDFCALNPAN